MRLFNAPNPILIPMLLTALVVALFSSAATFTVTRLTYQSRLNAAELSHQMALNAITTAAFLDAKKALAQLQSAQEKVHQLDEDYLKRLQDEQHTALRLRDDLLTERRRVQFAKANLATCELTVHHTARAGSVGDVATVGLTRKAGLLVHDLRTGIQQDRAKITYLQSYICDVVRQCEAVK